MKIIEIDLGEIRSKIELVKLFYVELMLPYSENDSFEFWDALNDNMTSLHTDSKIISESNPIPEHIHLVIRNDQRIKVLDKKDQEIFKDMLINLTDNSPEMRGIGSTINIKFAFEVQSGTHQVI